MLKTTNDMRIGQPHNIKVEKLPNGQFRASDAVLGDRIAPVVADTQDQAVGLLSNKLHLYDVTGEPQK